MQALMDLALHRFAGPKDGPHQVHQPWSVVADSPGASTQVLLPSATVDHTGIAAGMSTPFVSTLAPVVEQPGVQAKGFPTLGLVESRVASIVRTVVPVSLSHAAVGSSGGLVAALFAQLCTDGALTGYSGRGQFVQCVTAFTRNLLSTSLGSGSPPAGGVLLPTTLDDIDDSVLGDPITYARCENFPGSESPLSLPVYAWPSGSAFLLDSTIRQTVLVPGSSALPAEGPSTSAPPLASGEGRLLETGLSGFPYRFSESANLPFTDGNPAYGLQVHHTRFLELVGAPESARLLDCSPTFWVDKFGPGTSDGGGH